MRVLLCSLATHGLLYPAIALAQALRARGHEVAFVTGMDFGGLLEGAGFQRIPRGSKDGESFQIQHWWLPPAVALQVGHIEHALARFSPEVIVGQTLALGPLLAAERNRLPVAVLGQAAPLWPTWPGERAPESETESRLAWRYQDMMQHYNLARARLGLPEVRAHHRESPLLGDLFLLRSVPELEGDVSILPERVHLIGACDWEPAEPSPELSAWLDASSAGDSPVIYVQHGRSFGEPSFWDPLVEALQGEPVRVIASVGRMDKPLGDVPANFFARPHVPQGLALQHARAVIAGGNSAAVLGALTHGLPSLLIPVGGEQPEVAERCERAGVARRLRVEEISAAAIARAARELLEDTTLQANARRLQRAFREHDGLDHAVACLERLASTRSPVLREDL